MKATHILLAALLALPASAQTKLTKAQRQAGEAEATAVINRFMGGQNQDALPLKVKVQLTLPKTADGRDSYSYSYSTPKGGGREGVLTIKASDGVAACRAFYDFTKSNGAGISSWSGNRFDASALTSQPNNLTASKTITSPFRDHQYMNVVTYGYTAPYWDEARWDQELDWMALHGIDMPLLLIAQEQVYREVFMDMGLTKEEIDAWEVGPAHLPWMRMGNLSGNSFDGPLGEGWNDTQVALCKHVIERMRRLGMKPICPAFGGFVPKTFVDHYDGEIDYTGWDWVPRDTRNYRLNPGSKAFAEVGTRFIRKWEEKFGKCTYYLSDSFNEMEIPQDKALMTSYGDAIYKSIKDANPDAVWTMQGWTVGFQRGSWGNGIFEALVKNVPDDKFMLLDMATDYNKTWWGSTYNWDEYPKFYGKEWVWSTIPNMGGKTAFTGVIDYYANGRLDAQNSPNRGNLTGYGVAAEGVENNEIIYELIADAGWTGAKDSIDVDAWLADYARCRYGDFTAQDKAYHDAMRKSVYNSFRDHPQFAWQVRNNIIGRGSVQVNADFYAAVETLFADAQTLKARKAAMTADAAALYQADLIEAAAMYTSGKIEEVNSNIRRAVEADNRAAANELLGQLSALMLHLDRALTAHPLYNIEVWEQKAMDLATNDGASPELVERDRKRNAVNARRIVSVWYGDHQKDEPVNDYACRIWAGLIRDYYLPRLIGTWNRRINGIPFDQIAFENSFVEKAPALSPQQPLADEDVIDYLAHLVAAAKQMASGAIDDGGDQQMQNWRDTFFKDGI
ncbi:MAG: alpha-N-acetylglucosaminidase TIM-barrel domain-containing protein [Bacteroidales bacterium]|nr:alpha-N-acetylglucosaminidase TIM-barrel domain-containing protein [Bacteroidales bacterium]